MALEANETGNLIGSDKVEGTAVYGAALRRALRERRCVRVSAENYSCGFALGT
jgi:hypothetical protein